ncbi:MAG: glutaredoxin family protein [Kyrpidia tusciae]|nr:glutaredoxin family protein [Kyrpidia tusciae]MBE3553355.1 glutaredoxin family protein [Kyrpidia tusciae]
MSYSVAAKDERPQVTLYTSSFCGKCRFAREFLNRLGIPFEEVPVYTPGVVEELLSRTGMMAAPTLRVGQDYVTGYDPGRFTLALMKNGWIKDTEDN